MAKKRKSRKPLKATPTPNSAAQLPNFRCYEGDHLDDILIRLGRSIESARALKGEQLPDKIWIKQQFAIGVNDVTRVLERMPAREGGHHSAKDSIISPLRKAALVSLQAVLLASDCNPRSLTKHIPSLASSRNVPVIFVRDNKGGSVRLGQKEQCQHNSRRALLMPILMEETVAMDVQLDSSLGFPLILVEEMTWIADPAAE